MPDPKPPVPFYLKKLYGKQAFLTGQITKNKDNPKKVEHLTNQRAQVWRQIDNIKAAMEAKKAEAEDASQTDV